MDKKKRARARPLDLAAKITRFCVVLAMAMLAQTVAAQTQVVTTDAQLRAALADASVSTIQLGANITVTGGTLTLIRPVTIDTNGFTLVPPASGAAGTHLAFALSGHALIVSGSGLLQGGSVNPAANNFQGGSVTVNGGSITNDGALLGGTGGGGSGGFGGFGLSLQTSTGVNNGTITGGTGGPSTVVPGNTGTGGTGVAMTGSSSLVNNGVIAGGQAVGANRGSGVIFTGTATLTNNGRIEGRLGVVAGGLGTTTATIVNTGLIQGEAGGQAILTGGTTHLTVINSGTLRPGAGQSTALAFSTAATATSTLELHPGSVIEGNVLASSTNANDTLRLGGAGSDTFNVAEIGTKYSGFVLFEKNGASTWTLTGTTATATPWRVLAGTLAFAGPGGVFTMNGDLTNAATVQIGGPGAGEQLVLNGNLISQNGTVAMNTVLGGDASASDRLVLNGGTVSGTTGLRITNAGGAGAAITADGIELITATGGATTGTGFSLANPVKGGVYQYYLAKGGSAPGAAENWYLRNFIVADAGPAIPSYRPEAPIYSEMASVARHLSFQQIGSFRDRLLESPAEASASGGSSHRTSLPDHLRNRPLAWGRAWGGRTELNHEGSTDPNFDGWFSGIQLGRDLYVDAAGGHGNRYGAFFSFAHATGDVRGLAVGTPDREVGELSVNAYSLGGYWTHVGQRGWYTDTVLMGSFITADGRSNDGDGGKTDGVAFTASVEGGLPLQLARRLVLEPQAQFAWQHLSLNGLDDGISTVDFREGDSYRVRLGARLRATMNVAGSEWQPYVQANVLRNSGRRDATTFSDGTTLSTEVARNATEIGLGATGNLGKLSSVYGALSYVRNAGGPYQRTAMANAGVRIAW